MVNSYKQFVAGFERLMREGERVAKNHARPRRRRGLPAAAPVALIFSPHPDDECIIGGLPLRLLRQERMRVVNVAVTLGSKPSRRRARLAELKKACGHLGFELLLASPEGLQPVDMETRRTKRGHWATAVQAIVRILQAHPPRVIFLPHEHDGHPTHVGTHFLVMDALKAMPAGFECYVVETEFWGQMAKPNLMVEIGADDLAGLVAALALHVGEVRRNAYHLRLPAWMMDNVRRAEAVGGPGSPAPDFTFATNYRLSKWRGGRLREVLKEGEFLSLDAMPGSIFDEAIVIAKVRDTELRSGKVIGRSHEEVMAAARKAVARK